MSRSEPTGNDPLLSRRQALLVPATAALAMAVGLQARGQLRFPEPEHTVELPADAPDAPVEHRFAIHNPGAFAVSIIGIEPVSRRVTAALVPERHTLQPGETRELIVTAPPTGARREPQRYDVRVRTDQRENPDATLTLAVATAGWQERQAQQEAARARRQALLDQLEITPATLAWTVGEPPEPKQVTVRRRDPAALPDLHIEAFALPQAVLERRQRALAERATARPNAARRGRSPFDTDAFDIDVQSTPDAGWTVTVTPRLLDTRGRSIVRLVARPDGKPPAQDTPIAPLAEGGVLLTIPVAVRPAATDTPEPEAQP